MSKNKRYYWLKLKEDFFEDDTISWLEEQENGKDYVIFYLKLCLKSLKDEGQLIRYVGERLIPYDVKALAKITNTAPDTVAVAMQAFLDIGLIEHLETGEIYMTQINEMIGSETDAARRKRKQRAREAKLETVKQEKLEECDNVTEVSQGSHTEIDIEIDIEKDKELQQEKEKNKNQVVVVDPEINMVHTFFQNNFSELNQHIKQDLSDWIDEIGSELVLVALKKSIEAEKNYNYAKGIMRNWKQNDVKSIQDMEEEEKAFVNRKRKVSGKQVNSIKEKLPKWARENYQSSEEKKDFKNENVNDRLTRLNNLKKERGIIK
jgi:predicted phage replisome organizer